MQKNKVINKLHKLFKKNKSFLFLFFCVSLLSDIFYFTGVSTSDFRILLIVIVWVIVIRFYKLKSTATLKLILVLLSAMGVFYLFSKTSYSLERIAIWIYILLIIGVLHQLVEMIRNEK